MKAITAKNKVKLILWMSNNKNLCETLTGAQLSRYFTKETGIPVSVSSIYTYCKEVFPDLATKQVPGGHMNGGKLLARITKLEERIDFLEEYLFKPSSHYPATKPEELCAKDR